MERPYIARLLELVSHIEKLPGYHVETTVPMPANAEYGKTVLTITITSKPKKATKHGKAKERRS